MAAASAPCPSAGVRISRCPESPRREGAVRGAAGLALAALLVAVAPIDASLAGSRDNQYNSRYNSSAFFAAIRKQQAEMERRAKEQARQQQQAVRSMNNKANGPPSNARNEKRTRKDGDDPADQDDDASDTELTDAERNVRDIARMRQHELERVQRDHEQMVRKEQVRAERIRERMLRKREQDLTRALKERAAAKPPPALVRAVAAQEGPADAVAGVPRPFDGLSVRASHLGMSRNALKGEAGTPEGDPGRDTSTDGGAESVAGKGRGATGAAGGTRTAMQGQVDPRSFPGRDLGAEMPIKTFVDARRDELVISDISPVDLETVRARGFIVSEPVELKGAGTQVRRLRAPGGFTRDEAERELHKVLPFLPATPNHAYTIFMGTLGETEGASALPGLDPRKISPASASPCPAQTCFGGPLIKWSPSLGACTKDVRIGVIDTSFDVGHPAFRSLKSVQGEFLGGERPSPYDWHGTAVLSLLAGNPRSGTPGLVPDATFLLASAFRSDVNGNASTDTVRLLSALDWLDQLDVNIVNMSFSGPQDGAVGAAIERMSKKGVVFIAAAGNMGPTAAPSYPAAYPHVVAVTAVNRDGLNYKSANRGSYIDVSAPGVDVLTALPDAKQGYRTGTSFAVPFVTAIVAANVSGVRSVRTEKDILGLVSTRDLGPPGPDPIYGAGLAMAPQRCARGGPAVANGNAPQPSESWDARTTLIKAGKDFAP